jgi:hypothetical protein
MPLAIHENDYIGPLFLNGLYLMVFLIMWAFAKPEISRHRVVAFCLCLIDACIIFNGAVPGFGRGINAPYGMLLIPLGLIWFADVLGAFRGFAGQAARIDVDTPGWMVAGFGWIILLVGSFFIIRASMGEVPEPVG